MATMPRKLQIAYSLIILALIIGAPLWYKFHRDKKYRGFRVVEEGVLYRAGQLAPQALQRVLHAKNIRTVVNLRNGASKADQEEEAYCLNRGVKYVRIAQRPYWSDDGSVPGDRGIREFLDIMKDPENHPVMVHCYAGEHRTGIYCAAFRMAFHDWPQADAIWEMYQLGYRNIFEEWDVHGYLRRFHIERNGNTVSDARASASETPGFPLPMAEFPDSAFPP